MSGGFALCEHLQEAERSALLGLIARGKVWEITRNFLFGNEGAAFTCSRKALQFSLCGCELQIQSLTDSWDDSCLVVSHSN